MSDKTQNTKNQTLDEFNFLRIHHLYHFYKFYQTKIRPLSGRWLLASNRFQVSVFRCQPNSSKLKAEGSMVDGQGSYKAGKLDDSKASTLLASRPFSLEPSALSQLPDT
jgi:hypothetical protein